jgi:uncharacterized membrane protein
MIKLSFSENLITTFLIFMTKNESAQNGYLIIGLVQKRTQADQSKHHMCVVTSLILLSSTNVGLKHSKKLSLLQSKCKHQKLLNV